jgi:type IV pilus secretin PilQ/predicted competence protein
MNKQFKWMLAIMVAGLLVLALPPADVGAAETSTGDGARRLNLLDVSVEAASSAGPEVTLAADGQVSYESFVLDSPDRLVLDLAGVINRVEGYKLPVGEGGLVGIRTAQHTLEPQPVTRIVFDLESPLDYQIEQSASQLTIRFGEGSEQIDEQIAETDPESVSDILAELEGRTVGESEPVEEIAIASVETERAVEPDVIDRLLETPAYAAPPPPASESAAKSPSKFETQVIVTDEVQWSGKRISLNLVDADIKQVFRLFHELSGLNFVLDPAVSGRVTIVLDQVPWTQALDIILKNNGLNKVLEGNVLRIATTQKLAQEAAARRQLRDAKELEVEPITLTRTLSYAKAIDVEKIIRSAGILSQRGSVIVDERTNMVIVSDVPKKVGPIDELISTLDSETPQVMIEARIVETSRRHSRDLGVVFGVGGFADAAHGTATGLSFPHNVTGRYGLNLPGAGVASNLAFTMSNVVDSFTLDVQLNALEESGSARIISTPKIAVQNNERAEIEQGTRIPIVNTTATEINVEFVSASLKLSVLPQITAEGTIILDVEVENNAPDFLQKSGDIPSIRTERAQTKILVADGGTTVIAGIFIVNEGESEIGVPWFRNLPGLGWLFRTRNTTFENRELLIFITPKIVKLN